MMQTNNKINQYSNLINKALEYGNFINWLMIKDEKIIYN
jgi:hypothetical protein